MVEVTALLPRGELLPCPVQTTRRLFVGVQAAADGFFAGLQCLSPFLITKPLWLDPDFA